MADTTVEIQLEVIAKQALESVKSFTKSAQGQLNTISLNTSISAIKDGFDLIGKVASPVFNAIKDGFELAKSEALEAEAAQFKLENALRLTGDAADGALEKFQNLASSLQKTTVFSDDTVLASVGLAKQFQLTNKEAEKVIKVAADLAAATGTDLESAVQKVSQTFSGFVDRGLGKSIPGLKSLSRESLIAGNAVDIIGARVKGTAEAFGNTFAGGLQKAQNQAKELFETLGKTVVDNAAVKAGIQVIVSVLENLNDTVTKNSSTIKEFVTVAFVALIGTLPIVARGLNSLVTGFITVSAVAQRFAAVFSAIPAILKSTDLDVTKQLFSDLGDRLEKIGEEAFALKDAADQGFTPLIEAAQKMADGVKKAAESTKEVGKAVNQVTNSTTGLQARLSEQLKTELDEAPAKIAKLKDALSEVVRSKVQEITSSPISGLIKFVIKGQEELDKTKAKIDSQVRDLVKDLPESFKQFAINAGEETKKGLEQSLSNSQIGFSFGTKIIQGIKKGAEGALEVVSGIVEGVGTAFFGPVIGGFLGELTSFLGQGKDKVKEQITAFAQALPDVVSAIVEAIPALVQTLVEESPKIVLRILQDVPQIINRLIEGIPKFIESLVEKLPELIEGFVKAIPKVIVAMQTLMPRVAIAFITALISNIPAIVKGFGEEFLKLPGQIVQAIVDGIKDAVSSIGSSVTDVFGGGGGGGGIGGFLDSLNPFAEGGRVPNVSKFEGDRFPARLNAGEQVLDKDLSQQLETFLASGGSSGEQNLTINIRVGEQQLAQAILNLNRRGFRTA